MQDWIAMEARTVNFGDDRLDRRYEVLLDRLSDKPTLSIPAACNGLAETTAGYRFFNNKRVTAANVLAPHKQATIVRIREQSVVLLPQDTTEVDVTRKQERVGGPLTDAGRYGILVHPILAITPERVPLGVVDAKLWSRDADRLEKTREEKKREQRGKPIEEKESFRWLEGYRQACAVAAQAPQTTVVSLADSEGDIYEIFVEGRAEKDKHKAEWIVRACQDRNLDEDAGHLYESAAGTAVLGKLMIRVSKREATTGNGCKRKRPRSARKAEVSVRAKRMKLKAPWRKGTNLPSVYVNVVLVREENPPEGEIPVEWLLLTSLPITTFDDVCRVIDYYVCRWEIEIYFRTLKSGCKIEELQLETEDRLKPCVALYMIVAWRVLHLLMLGRKCPELPCDVVFADEEWKATYTIVKHETAPASPPPLGMMVELIASLGGWLGRKHDGPPGPQTMWIGLQRVRDFAIAWNTFGPSDKKRKTCVER